MVMALILMCEVALQLTMEMLELPRDNKGFFCNFLFILESNGDFHGERQSSPYTLLGGGLRLKK